MIRWPPIRSDNAPAIGATKIGIAVQGRIRSPACSGEKPWTVWKNWISKKIDPNIPKNMNSDETLVSVNVRFRKKRIGSIGASARSSQSTNSATTTAPTTSEPTISGEPQPTEFPRTSPQTIPNSPALASTSPGRSSRPGRPVRLVEPGERHRGEQEADRHVEPEDPLPREALDDRAADERPDCHRESADTAPGSKCEPTALARNRCGKKRQGQRRDDRSTDALNPPRE